MKGWWNFTRLAAPSPRRPRSSRSALGIVCASSTVALVLAIGCSGGAGPPPRVAVMTVLGPKAGMSADCGIATTTTQLTIGDPGSGPYPNSSTPTFEQGSAFGGGSVKFDCSVIPDGAGGFKVNGRAQLTGSTADKNGTFSLSGTFTPKATGGAATGVNATFTTQNGTFTGANCTVKYSGVDTNSGSECATAGRDPQTGSVLCTASSSMDVKAGAVWASVFCDTVSNSAANPPRTCRASATFRFENCVQAVQQ